MSVLLIKSQNLVPVALVLGMNHLENVGCLLAFLEKVRSVDILIEAIANTGIGANSSTQRMFVIYIQKVENVK